MKVFIAYEKYWRKHKWNAKQMGTLEWNERTQSWAKKSSHKKQQMHLHSSISFQSNNRINIACNWDKTHTDTDVAHRSDDKHVEMYTKFCRCIYMFRKHIFWTNVKHMWMHKRSYVCVFAYEIENKIAILWVHPSHNRQQTKNCTNTHVILY